MPSSATRRAASVPAWLITTVWIFAAISAALWLLGFAGHTKPGLFPAGPDFLDITVYKARFAHFHTRNFFLLSRGVSSFAYPAGAAPLYEFFYKTGNATRTYLLLSAATCCAAALTAWLFLRRHQAAALFVPLLLLTYPVVFLIQRANIELILWIIIALGLIAFRRNLGIVAAILFGIAAAIKLYPILLLGLFLKRKQQLPAFCIGIASALFSTLAALLYTGPDLSTAAAGFYTGVDRFQDHYVVTVSNVEVAFDHCLFSPAKYYAWLHHLSPADWTTLYLVAGGTLALLLFLRVRTLPPLNRIVFLVAAMVCLPPVSFVYTLVHLLLPLVLVIAAAATRARTPTLTLALLCLLFLMLPLNALNAIAPTPAGPIQALALLLLLLLAATQSWPDASLPDAA